MASQEGYHPRFSDSAQAGAVLPDDFLKSFKKSLLAEYKGFVESEDFVSFTLPNSSRTSTHTPVQVQPSQLPVVSHDKEIDHEHGPRNPSGTSKTVPGMESMGVSDLNYPLSLFDVFPDLPPASIIEDLTQTFETAFLKKCPFLSSLSNPDSPVLAGLTGKTPVPPYLAFVRALVGTLVSKRHDCQIWAHNLYETTLKLFVGSVELDNRTSRNIHWYEAGLLLVIYGTLHSDDSLWETTTIVNGYFVVPYKRRGLLQIVDSDGTLDCQDMSLINSFYFFIDIFRAIHLNTPPSFNHADLSFPLATPSAGRFEDLYKQIIVARKSLAPNLTSDEYLLALLCILYEVVQLLRFLGPFTDDKIQHTRDMIDDQSRPLMEGPYLPASASREYLQQSEALIGSLEVWCSSVNYLNSGHSSGENEIPNYRDEESLNYSTLRVQKNVLPVAYFCRILLEVGPRALELPKIAGYDGLARKKEVFSSSNSKPHFLGIHVSDIAVESAWNILDVLDEEKREEDTKPTHNHPLIPLWFPLVVFYAGLTVWARMQEDQDLGVLKGAQNSLSARRRLLRSFQTELQKMGKQYKSASRMADVIKNLCP